MIRCQTLGQVAVSVNGGTAPPELLWRKHLALLVVLSRAPRRTRSREQLTGLLWSEKAESAARHSLNEALRVIRRTAGDDALETRADRITLAPGSVELDVEVLDRLAEAGDLPGASALVLGEFLEGFSIPGATEFETWLSSERRHWSARGVAVLCALAEQEAGAGRIARAVSAAERALRLDSVSERAVSALLRGLVLQGDRAIALERYEAYAAHVRDRLGAEPSGSVRALVDRIRADRPRSVRPAIVAAANAERRRAPLVGRESELGALLGTWGSAVAEQEPRTALVIAEAGMGRTRLAEELASRVRLDGGVVAHARAIAADRDLSESGLVALAGGDLATASGVSGASRDAIAVMAGRVPGWERFARDGGADERSPLGPALIAVLRAVGENAPILVWIDDAHFLDAASFGFLDRIARDLSDLPVMCLIAAAPLPARDEIDSLRARMGRELTGVTLVPGPLDIDAVRLLAAWGLANYSVEELDRVSRRLLHDTAGLPLLLVELLDAVADGLDVSGESAWPQPFRTLDQTMPGELPDTITAAIRMSFRRLSAEAQKVLATASALSDRVNAADLERATGIPRSAVVEALDELEWSRWLTAEPRGYTFMARVVRDVIARDMLTPGQRGRILRISGSPGS
jgi:DNA-binding SARP family transcriptional activator